MAPILKSCPLCSWATALAGAARAEGEARLLECVVGHLVERHGLDRAGAALALARGVRPLRLAPTLH